MHNHNNQPEALSAIYNPPESIERQAKFKELGLMNVLPQTLFFKNRNQFIKMFKPEIKAKEAIGFFQGASEVPLYSSDVAYPEYQEAFFYYLMGVTEMDCFAVIDFTTSKSVLFVPRLDNFYKIWMTTLSLDQLKQKYSTIDEILFVDQMADWFKSRNPDIVYLNFGTNSDSSLKTMIPDEKLIKENCPQAEINLTSMHDILAESRVLKNDEELEVMRWASQITCEAHCNVMRNVKPGQRESQLESFFVYDGQQKYFCGRVQPYLSICGCGPGAATLHYHDNDKWLVDGQLMLTDQGHQLHHYVSDVTTSFPVNGKFTEKQKEIYNIVLKANRAVIDAIKPGIKWTDMHLLAERITLSELQKLGLVKEGFDIEKLIEQRAGFIFQPHGLGHLIGLDVHDVGGYLDGKTPPRILQPGLKNLRTARELKPGMCLTVEPGCYFRDFLLDGDFDKKDLNIDISFLDREKIKEYQKEVGGVRIEDVIYINDNGCELLSFGVPRTVEEIESCMRGEDWSKIGGGKL